MVATNRIVIKNNSNLQEKLIKTENKVAQFMTTITDQHKLIETISHKACEAERLMTKLQNITVQNCLSNVRSFAEKEVTTHVNKYVNNGTNVSLNAIKKQIIDYKSTIVQMNNDITEVKTKLNNLQQSTTITNMRQQITVCNNDAEDTKSKLHQIDEHLQYATTAYESVSKTAPDRTKSQSATDANNMSHDAQKDTSTLFMDKHYIKTHTSTKSPPILTPFQQRITTMFKKCKATNFKKQNVLLNVTMKTPYSPFTIL